MNRIKVSIYVVLLLFSIVLSCSNSGDREDVEPIDTGPTSCDISICSFNIQFLGSFKKKDNSALADILKNYDLVVIQELVSAPRDGTYPDGETYDRDEEAGEFFDKMHSHGFSDWLSEEDTGTNDEIHTKTQATEWWVAFYKSDKIKIANDLPSGFLASDRSNNDDYERVPYAFAFRTANSNMDFVLISVHLQPGDGSADQQRRKHEIESIAEWIGNHDSQEKDFIILGDMNIKDSDELTDITPSGYLSLNDECYTTNTVATDDASKGKPYDHVMYNTTYTTEIDTDYDINVTDLIAKMEDYWTSADPYPGDPYDHTLFRQYYSDHHPVDFKMICPNSDDD